MKVKHEERRSRKKISVTQLYRKRITICPKLEHDYAEGHRGWILECNCKSVVAHRRVQRQLLAVDRSQQYETVGEKRIHSPDLQHHIYTVHVHTTEAGHSTANGLQQH